MTLTATYADDLSRVRLVVASAPSAADYAVIERSTDQVTWSVVRGGDTLALTAGAGHLDDYEFAPGVPNYYRASYVDSGPISLVGTGTAVTGNNASLLPGDPAGVLAGDLLVVLASIRNSGAGTVNTPSGWTKLVDAGNVALLGKIAEVDGDGIPSISFSGGVANADTIAQGAAFRNAELIPASSNTQLNAAGQNVAYPALNVPGDNHLVLIAGWKQDDWTSTTAPTAKLGDTVSTAGDDAGQVWCYLVETSEIDVTAFTFGVTGGTAALSRGITAAFRPAAYATRDTVTITPNMTVAWLKNPRRPNLNTKITVTDWGTVTKPARAGVFDVIGRTYPIAVTDVRGSRRYSLTVTTVDLGAAEELDARLAQGDPVLLHVPPDAPFPGGYYVVGDVSIDRHSKRTLRRFFDLPLTEVAAPAGTIYSTTATYGDILAAYATYADLLAAEPTYSDVLDYIAPAGNVIVP